MAKNGDISSAKDRTGAGKPTLKTIASMTGLAVTTVSRALAGDAQIAERTRRRVAEVAEAIGYVPDRAAQRLRTGRTNVISFILEPHDEMLGFGSMMIAGIMAALRDTPFHLVVTPQFQGTDPVAPVRHIVRNRQADGIIFCRTQPLDMRARFLLEAGFPFVSHGRTELATPHPWVDFDNFEFAHEAVTRLAAQGFAKIVLISAPPPYTFAQHLMHGFMAAVRETGVDHLVSQEISINSEAEQVRQFAIDCIRNGNADAFVCAGETSAMAVSAGIADCGLTLSKDIGLVAKQTTPLFGQIRPPIDTIYEDLTEAGRELGTLLLRQIRGADPGHCLLHGHPSPKTTALPETAQAG